MSGNYATSQVSVPAATATEIMAITATCSGVRITYTPKVNGQILYLGTSSSVTNANGYPIPPGVEYQLPAITADALYAYIPQGGATVSVAVFS